MLKLSKYEFRKNRTFLFIIFAGLLLLEGYFIGSIILQKEEHSGMSAAFLSMYAMVCYFAVFILAIANYSKELNSRSSYLIFMTPNSSLSIIFSKMFTILMIGFVLVLAICGLGYLDIQLLINAYPKIGDFKSFINSLLEAMGISSSQLALSIAFAVVEFLISFFSTITLIYFAITLSATLLQNNRFKGFVSFALFIALSYITGFITDKLPIINDNAETFSELMVNLIPTTLFDLIIMIGCILGCSTLLDKKVSL